MVLAAISAEAIAELRQNLNEASQVMSKLGKSGKRCKLISCFPVGVYVVCACQQCAKCQTLDMQCMTSLCWTHALISLRWMCACMLRAVAPWTVFKNKRRAKRSVEALESQKQALATLLSNTYDELRQNRQATSTAISEADAAKSHEAGLRDMIAQQEAAIEKLRAQVSELKEHNAVQKAQQETLLTKVEEVAPGKLVWLKYYALVLLSTALTACD